MSSLNQLLEEALSKRRAEDSLRSLKNIDPSLIDFSSNDYLGLARSSELSENIKQKINSISEFKNGATGSRLLTGNYSLIETAEHQLAKVFNAEATLIFSSGYNANLAVISSVPKRGDTILYDEKSHASIKDAMRLSLAKHHSFKHNDIQDLERKIQKAEGSTFVVVESVYSMDGDVCPLEAVAAICQNYNANLLVDEAHSTGVYGSEGNGLSCQMKLEAKTPIRIYTFGKGMGVHGACVAGSKQLRDYLINFARPFIYSTAPDAHSVVSILESFDFLKKNIHLQAELQQNVKTFKEAIESHPALTPGDSAIQSFLVPGNSAVKNAALILQKSGFDVRPILSPTVTAGSERLRIIIHAYNTKSEILALAKALLALS
jgi:8-amino-7-oxononanoate synthase